MVGRLIAIEGVDGAGTTTQCRRIVAWLNETGRPAIATREPSDGPIGELLRQILRGQHASVDRAAIALLFAADRLDHLTRVIVPHLDRGDIVITDRYLLSSLAYQAIDLPEEFVRAINQRAREPDLTVLVDVAIDRAAERRRLRGGPDELFDALEFQREVAATYRKHAEQAVRTGLPFAIVDGNGDIDSVFHLLREVLGKTCLDKGRTTS